MDMRLLVPLYLFEGQSCASGLRPSIVLFLVTNQTELPYLSIVNGLLIYLYL